MSAQCSACLEVPAGRTGALARRCHPATMACCCLVELVIGFAVVGESAEWPHLAIDPVPPLAQCSGSVAPVVRQHQNQLALPLAIPQPTLRRLLAVFATAPASSEPGFAASAVDAAAALAFLEPFAVGYRSVAS